MIVNTSRILTTEKEIPKVLVNDSGILLVKPLTANQLQISALKPGVTQIALWDSDGKPHDVVSNDRHSLAPGQRWKCNARRQRGWL